MARLNSATFDEMAQLEAALQRLDSGTYGDCADCGESISLQRLRGATRCAALRTVPGGPRTCLGPLQPATCFIVDSTA